MDPVKREAVIDNSVEEMKKEIKGKDEVKEIVEEGKEEEKKMVQTNVEEEKNLPQKGVGVSADLEKSENAFKPLVGGGRGGSGRGGVSECWRNENQNGGARGGGTRGRGDKGDANNGGYNHKFQVKNPLQHEWCLWILQSGNSGYGKRDNWCEQQTLVNEFKTVEDFWSIYNNIHSPSYIGNSDYSLFKKGIQPAWEDKKLENGGRWVVRFPPRYRPLDEMWLALVLTMIGENFDSVEPEIEEKEKIDKQKKEYVGNAICGSVVKSRKGFVKIELWISDTQENLAMKIGRVFQDAILPYADQKQNVELHFECFNKNDEHKKFYLPPIN